MMAIMLSEMTECWSVQLVGHNEDHIYYCDNSLSALGLACIVAEQQGFRATDIRVAEKEGLLILEVEKNVLILRDNLQDITIKIDCEKRGIDPVEGE